MRLVEARLAPRPFAGPGLTLALSLFMPCALIGFVRMRQVALWTSGGVVDFENLIQKIQETLPPFYLGMGASIIAFCIHSLIYLLTRSRQPPEVAS